MSQSGINVLQILVSAASGAIAGSLMSIITGPTQAEREERGRRRVAARQGIGRALQNFRYDLANTRLALLESQIPDTEALIKAAFELANEVYVALPVVSKIERNRLKRVINTLLGREMLEVARLRPHGKEDVTDVASVSAALHYRSTPGSHLRDLLGLDPLSREWDAAIRIGEKLSRKYL